tara:strand:+ start:52 stop:255 length:204 start_codon:yes stop_codon:yes gene_type:complete
MKLIDKVKELKHSIKELTKLNEDLIEKNLADKRKINSLERRISNLKNAIGENINDLEKFVKENNANF